MAKAVGIDLETTNSVVAAMEGEQPQVIPNTAADARTVRLPSGEPVPALGMGTWGYAEDPRRHRDEIASLRLGIDLGMTLIDTAEMSARGGAERLVGEAIAGRRDEVFLVSKVVPANATCRGTIAACEASLRRLGTDRIDLYLLHWRGRARLGDTLAAFAELVAAGCIRHWGVSNFDVADMDELVGLPGGDAVAADQVLYNPTRRGIEYDLVPWSRERGVPLIAYSPVEQGRLLSHPALTEVCKRHGATPAQVALAWVLRQDQVTAIPRAGTPEHVRENHAALDLTLTPSDLAELDRAFPAPRGPRPLEML